MPSPTIIFSQGTFKCFSSSFFKSKASGSPYLKTSAVESAMTCLTFGEGPKLLSFAPSLAIKGIPEIRSVISGATNGTLDGSEFARLVNLGDRFLSLLIIQSNIC